MSLGKTLTMGFMCQNAIGRVAGRQNTMGRMLHDLFYALVSMADLHAENSQTSTSSPDLFQAPNL